MDVTISISGGGGKLGQEVGEEDEENKLQFIGKHKRWWDPVSLLTISQNCIPFESFVFTLAWLRLSFWLLSEREKEKKKREKEIYIEKERERERERDIPLQIDNLTNELVYK